MKLFDRFKGKEEAKPSWFKVYEENDIPEHIDYPDTSLFEVVRKKAEEYPDYIAYSYYGTNCTYKQFIKEVRKCARSFKKLGIKQGEIVTICMPNTPEAFIAFYALNMIGAIANMIHPLSSEGEIKHYCTLTDTVAIIAADFTWLKLNAVLEETSVRNVILLSVDYSMNLVTTFGYWLTKGRKINKSTKKALKENRVMNWKEFINLGRQYLEPLDIDVKGNDPAVILHSGGTTGKPKGILLSNMNFNSVVMQELAVNKVLGPKVSILSIMPIFHGFGLGSCVHACLASGGRSIILPSVNPKTFDDTIRKYKPNIIACVPGILEGLINSKKFEKTGLSFLKCVLCGGDSLSTGLKNKIDEFLHNNGAEVEVRTAYGLTECVSGTCMMPIGMHRDNSIGIPCPDSYFKIIQPSSHIEMPVGEEGEICVNGPSVMMGYLKDPRETTHTLQIHEDGKIWLHTGDLGFIDADGFVYFKQRLKRMIVSSGYNIYPQHIESVIDSHPAVLTSTVIGIDHRYKGQVAKAFIILKDGIEPTMAIKNSIKEHCEKNISKFTMPYEFEYRESLPKTLVGKVAYNTLLEEEKNKKNRG